MKVKFQDLGAVGWIPDVDGFELPPNAFTDALNVRFTDGYAEVMGGNVELATDISSSFIPYWLQQYSATTSTKYLIVAGLTAVYALDSSGVSTDITGTAPTGTADDRWAGGVLFGVLGMTNGVDVPMFWAGNLASNLATFTGWNSAWRCKSLRPFKNYWVALNITKSGTAYPHMVKWSHTADPGSAPSSWDETDPALDAGEVNLDGQDVIVDALPLGDALIIYKERSAYAMRYIGGSQIFAFERLPLDHGMRAKGCGAVCPAGHVVLTASDLVLTNGQSSRSIVAGKARTWLFDTLDPTKAHRAFIVTNTDRREVWTCIPQADDEACTIALIWNWENDTLTKRNLPTLTHGIATDMDVALDPFDWIVEATYGGSPVNPVGAFEYEADTGTFDEFETLLADTKARLIAGYNSWATTAGAIYMLDAGHIDNSEPASNTTTLSFMVGRLERTGLQLGDDLRFTVRAVWPRFTGDGITGSYLPSMYLNATDSPETAASFSLAASKEYSPQRYAYQASGRYLHYRIDISRQYPARIRSMTWDVEKLGQF